MQNRSGAILQKGVGRKRRQSVLEYIYETDSVYFAQVSESVKKEAAEELGELGAQHIKERFRGIRFSCDRKTFYKIVYMSRLLSRVLAPLKTFGCRDTDELYKNVKKIKWEQFLAPKSTFAVVANVSNSEITHSKFAAYRVKDAVVDYFSDRSGKRPNVDTDDPDLVINLHVKDDKADISIDASGGALHRRGYREETVSAPMQETVAAAMIRLSGWDGKTRLHDPMCGSGTILCEALMQNSRIPAGIFRKKFGFQKLPDYDETLWKSVKAEMDAGIRETSQGLVSGGDLAEEAVNASKTNLMGLHYGNRVEIRQQDLKHAGPFSSMVIMTNPPYGIRMGKDMDLKRFYKTFGDFLKQKCKGSEAYVYFGDPGFIKSVSLKPSWKKELRLGGLDGRLVKYTLY